MTCLEVIPSIVMEFQTRHVTGNLVSHNNGAKESSRRNRISSRTSAVTLRRKNPFTM